MSSMLSAPARMPAISVANFGAGFAEPDLIRGAVMAIFSVDKRHHQLFTRYPDDTVVHPGHGDDTTLGTERSHLEEWKSRGW